MSASAIQTRIWTREEYDRLVATGIFHPDERLELVNGEILTMSPQGSLHATAVRLMEEALRTGFGHGFDVRVHMPLALGPHSEPEPDLAVVVGTPRDYRTAHPHTASLVVEVADTTLSYDRNTKATLYACAGIPEYWIVNLLERQIEVFHEPQQMSQHNVAYHAHRIYLSSESISPRLHPHAIIIVTDLLP